MSKITSFDRASAKAVHDRFTIEVKRLAESLGLEMRGNRAQFSTTDLTLKFKVGVKEVAKAGGETIPAAQQRFHDFCTAFGLKSEHYGRRFIHLGETFRVHDVAPASRKYPFLVERLRDHKVFKFPAALILAGLVPEEKPKPAGVIPMPNTFKGEGW